jgi:hypothetical protein
MLVQGLVALGVVEPSRSVYVPQRIAWVAHMVGGVLFGIGMVLAGGCVSRNLVRAGMGDLRALLSLLVLALAAGAATGPWLGPPLTGVGSFLAIEIGLAPTSSLGDVLGAAMGVSASIGRWLAAMLVAGALLAWVLADREFRSARRHVLAGLGVGFLVAAGWAVTGLAYSEWALALEVQRSLSFVRPTAMLVEWLRLPEAQGWPPFEVSVVAGTMAGALLAGWSTGGLRLATFADVGDTLRAMGGMVLMGIGGVMAGGCTIGQGVTGLATLSLGSMLTLVSLVIGGAFGVVLLQRWLSSGD